MNNASVHNTDKNVFSSVSRAQFSFANAARFSSYCVYYYYYYRNFVAHRKGR